MTQTGYSISPVAKITDQSATNIKALANKTRELELKVAGLDNNQVESDDIDTETTLQEMER